MSLTTNYLSKLKVCSVSVPKLIAGLDTNLLASSFAAVTCHIVSSGNMETTVIFLLAAIAGLPRITESFRESKKSGLRAFAGLSCITAALTASTLVFSAL